MSHPKQNFLINPCGAVSNSSRISVRWLALLSLLYGGDPGEGNLKASDLVGSLYSENLVLRFQKRITLPSPPFGMVIIGVALMRFIITALVFWRQWGIQETVDHRVMECRASESDIPRVPALLPTVWMDDFGKVLWPPVQSPLTCEVEIIIASIL